MKSLRKTAVLAGTTAAVALGHSHHSHSHDHHGHNHHHDQRKIASFEELKNEVTHTVHQPVVHLGDLDSVVDDDLRLTFTLPMPDDTAGGSSTDAADGNTRTATVSVGVSTNLIGPDYVETIHHSNGTSTTNPLPEGQQRCYWNGAVEFSDGTTGSMTLTTCSRTSIPHAEYLTAQGYPSQPANSHLQKSPLHFIHGIIHDHNSGRVFGVEPRDWVGFRDSDGNAASRRRFLRSSSSASGGDSESLDEVGLGDHYVYDLDEYAAISTGGTGHDCSNSDTHFPELPEEVAEQIRMRRQLAKEEGGSSRHWRNLSPEERRRLATKKDVEVQVVNDASRNAAFISASVTDNSLAIMNNVANFYGTRGVTSGLNDDRKFMVAKSGC